VRRGRVRIVALNVQALRGRAARRRGARFGQASKRPLANCQACSSVHKS